jgi:quercetin dioxygenase-like cupin family protein
MSSVIERLHQHQDWNYRNHDETILLKANRRNIILVVMHEGSELRMHQREEPVSLQIIEGVLKVTDQDGSTFLNKDQYFVLNKNIKHGFIAMDETIFLLNLQSKYR